MAQKNVLHIVNVSFVINHFFGKQFNYLKMKTGNTYFLGCTASQELDELSKSLGYIPFEVEVTRSVSFFKDLIAVCRIYNFIKTNKIEVVVGHTPKGGMVAMIASFLARVPDRVYFRHGIIYETSSGLKRALLKNIDRLSGTLATKVICVSNSVKRISESDRLNRSDKNIILGLGTCNGVNVIDKYNPINYTSDFRQTMRRQYLLAEEDIVVGYVGRLVKDKGIDELLKAWAILLKKYNHIKLLLVGPIEERDSISSESKAFIADIPSVIHTGFVLDSGPYFSVMDIFILPTYREGFPTVSLEASSMEVPVLITRATGCEEAIIDNDTGRFITHEIDSIVEKISEYIDNKDLREAHGKKGRQFVLNNFEQTKIWDEIHTKLEY